MEPLDLAQFDFTVDRLGPVRCQVLCNCPRINSSMKKSGRWSTAIIPAIKKAACMDDIPSMETAGPRAKIFHAQYLSRAAIVTCGGLCPGLNSVIKGIVETLHSEYGVREIYGIPYGYAGLAQPDKYPPRMLDPDAVDTIHMDGGSILAPRVVAKT